MTTPHLSSYQFIINALADMDSEARQWFEQRCAELLVIYPLANRFPSVAWPRSLYQYGPSTAFVLHCLRAQDQNDEPVFPWASDLESLAQRYALGAIRQGEAHKAIDDIIVALEGNP